MKRNRSIRTLPLDNLSLLNHPLPDPFGEEVAVFNKNCILSSDDSDIVLRDFGNSKSSSSSLSWGEEYKSETAKKVRDELERMDRVLRGVDPIPDNYDREEYEEWMHFFPNLCVLGTKFGTYIETTIKDFADSEEIIAVHPESSICDNLKTDTTVIKPKITLNDSLDVDSFLKVSPLLGTRLTRRQSSSRSLISSQISSSKWLKDEEYESLPFLAGVRGGKTGVPRGILKNSLVLPPIETSQFRSISATPRRESKSLSALSMKGQKYSGFKRK